MIFTTKRKNTSNNMKIHQRKFWKSTKGQGGSADVEDDISDESTFVVSSKVHYYFFIIIIIILGFIAFLLISQNYVDSLVSPPQNIEDDLVLARITNVCFSPTHPVTGYAQQGVIDVEQFTQTTLEECFSGEQPPRLTVELQSFDGKNFQTEQLFTSKGGLTQHKRNILIKAPGYDSLQPGWLYVGLQS